jgi:hypothetical protein
MELCRIGSACTEKAEELHLHEQDVPSHPHVALKRASFSVGRSATLRCREIKFPLQGEEVNNFQMTGKALMGILPSSEKNQEHFLIQHSILKTKAVVREVEIDFESASMLKDH